MRHETRCPTMGGVSAWHYGLIQECRGENCPCKEGHPVHPPVLFAFHPELGEYIPAEARCTARRAGYGPGFLKGQICGEYATYQFGDVWLCEPHWKRARKWALEELGRQVAIDEMLHLGAVYEERERLEREAHKERLRRRREEAALERELKQEQIRAEVVARAESSLIYYLQREDGSIKIGTSRTVADRAATLAREHGTLRLMATHGGGHKEEHALHGQFAVLRLSPRGEWFRPGLELLRHIRKVRQEHEVLEAKKLEIVDLKEIGVLIYRASREEREAAA